MKREPPRELKPNQSTDLVLREMWRAKDALSAARGHSMVASHEPDGRARHSVRAVRACLPAARG